MSAAHRDLPIGMAIALLGMLAFAGTLGGELLWDDPLILSHHRQLLTRGGMGDLLTTPYQAEGSPTTYFRPLVSVSFGAQMTLGAASPLALRLVNLLLYGAGIFLAFLLLRRFLSLGAAAFAAALFALHPVHAESLGMVSNRHDLMLGVLVPSAVLLWLRGREGSAAATAGGGACFLLALLSKETAYLLPAVLLLWDLLLPGEGRGWARRNLPWLAVWGAALAAAILLRLAVAGIGFGTSPSPDTIPLAGRLALLPGILLTYLRLLILPLDLSAFYTPDQLRPSLPALLGAAGGLAAFLLAAGGRDSRRAGLLGLGWFLLLLLPVLGIARQVGAPVAERHLFLPLLGFALAAGALLEWALAAARGKEARLILTAFLAALLLLLGFGSWSRSRVWHDELSLFSDLIRTAPRLPRAHYNLANALRQEGEDARAEAEYREAIALQPDYHDALANLAAFLATQERFHEAVFWYRAALSVEPRNPDDRLGLGFTLLQGGDAAGAASELEQALAAATDPVQRGSILVFLGDALSALGKKEEARSAWARALAEDPLLAGVRERLAR